MDVRAGARHGPGRRWRQRSAVTLVVAGAMLATAVVPAGASEPGAPASAAVSCETLDPAVTTTLEEVRQQVGAGGQAPTGAGVGVAIIDTGVNPVAGLTRPGKIVDGPDVSFDSQNPELANRDLHGHGTNMAAIVAGEGGWSGHGVAPGATLVNVKTGAADGKVDVSQVIAALDWVVQNHDRFGIRVVTVAFDTDATQSYILDPLSRAVENVWHAGVVVVVAGGNDGRALGRLGNPATNPFVISVGAAQADDSVAGFSIPAWSSTGNGVRNPDVVAPGSGILSAGVAGSYLAGHYPSATCHDGEGAMYLRGSGTSQAAAVVSGAAALLLEQRPALTPDQVKYLLGGTARSLGESALDEGAGLIDVGAALAAPTPGAEAVQTHAEATGLGSLEKARGSKHVRKNGVKLTGETTAFGGRWDPAKWRDAVARGRSWIDQDDLSRLLRWAEKLWGTATWSGTVWQGATWEDVWAYLSRDWSGATWSGATWSGATWSGATWSGATWSGATWSGATWSGATWSGATWSGATWSGATWSGASWS